MATRPKFKVQFRKILGKKTKELRKKGLVPAHIYGKGTDTLSVSVDKKTFLKVFEDVGETGLIDLMVDQQNPRPVLVDDFQLDSVSGELLHIDFHQVVLTEKVRAKIPIEIMGEAPAVSEKRGVLLTILDSIEVEALPTDLPEALKVDVSRLSEVDAVVKVSDLQINKEEIEVLADSNEILVKIGPLITTEMAEEIKTEEVAAAQTTEEKKAVEEEEKKEQAGEGEAREKEAP